jgi:hydrogenase maturation factor HypF (carbamoyltransferase family)
MQKLTEELSRVDKMVKQLRMENGKLKQRMVKIKQKKGKIDKDVRMCRKCGKEYTDKENFNWSCRTH